MDLLLCIGGSKRANNFDRNQEKKRGREVFRYREGGLHVSGTPGLDRFAGRHRVTSTVITLSHRGRLTCTRSEHQTAYPYSYCHSLMRASLGGSVRWQQQSLTLMKQPADSFEQFNESRKIKLQKWRRGSGL